jgi:tetratricopeptide (TPR) repeat protein
MSYRRKTVLGLLLLTCAGLVLRKQMVPGATLLLIISLSALSLLFLALCLQSLKYREDKSESLFIIELAYLDFSVSSLAFLFRLQYWDGTETLLRVAFILFVVLLFVVVYYFIFQRTQTETEKKIFNLLLFPFLFFLFVNPFSALTNQRQFHLFFKGSTYESYIRSRYGEEDAVRLLEENQCSDPSCLEKANSYYLEGIKNDSLKNWDAALECYNKAIDLNIHFVDAYYRRASNRMLQLVTDPDMVAAALRDCNSAIALDPSFAPAYMRRGFIYVHLQKHEKACEDLKKAKKLNDALAIDKYIKSMCGN